MKVRCKRCDRELTNSISIGRGYGPVCWRKLGSSYVRSSRKHYNTPERTERYVKLEEIFI